MIRVVIDTNTLVRCLTTHPDTVAGRLYAAWVSGTFELMISTFIVIEVRKTLERTYFRPRASAETRAAAIDGLRANATIVPVNFKSLPKEAPHWQDGIVLLTAAAGRADYLVTEDAGLHRHFSGTEIINPDQFLATL